MQYMQQWQQYQQQMGQSTGYDYSSYYQNYSTDQYSSFSDSGSRGQTSNTLWVGSLPWECSEQDLRDSFQEYGNIENIRMLPAKNCAFVTFTHIECAIKAHEQSYSIFVKGSPVKIGWGKPPSNIYQRNPYDGMPPSRNLWVGYISVTTSEDDLRNFFIQFGPIERVKVLPHKQCAFILYTHLESAIKAKDTMNGQMFRGNTIKVNYGKQSDTPQQNQYDRNENIQDLPKPQPPSSPEIQQMIDKLAFSVSRSQNGDALEEMVRVRQAENSKFSFLHGGEGSEYYKWKLKVEKAMVPKKTDSSDIPPWLLSAPETKIEVPPAVFPHIEEPLNSEEKKELYELLENLLGTKDSIKAGRDWIFKHLNSALVVSKIISDYVVTNTSDFSKQLTCLHLLFDVLHHSYNKLRKPGDTMDEMSYSVKLHLGFMMRKAFVTAENEEQRDKVTKLLYKWREKNIFDEETLTRVEEMIKS